MAAGTIVQVSLTILVLSMKLWYPGFVIIACATLILLAVCLLGTILEVKYDQFNAALYEIPWYLMPLKHQRMFLCIIRASQMKKPLTFWKIAEVTVSSFLEVCL